MLCMAFPGGSDRKDYTYNAGELGLILGLGRSPGGGHGNSLQYSCLENPHGYWSLAGCSPWGCKELHPNERLSIAQHAMVYLTLQDTTSVFKVVVSFCTLVRNIFSLLITFYLFIQYCHTLLKIFSSLILWNFRRLGK